MTGYVFGFGLICIALGAALFTIGEKHDATKKHDEIQRISGVVVGTIFLIFGLVLSCTDLASFIIKYKEGHYTEVDATLSSAQTERAIGEWL